MHSVQMRMLYTYPLLFLLISDLRSYAIAITFIHVLHLLCICILIILLMSYKLYIYIFLVEFMIIVDLLIY